MLNGANFLPEFLDGLEKQKGKNFELIVIDGGSSDNSMQLVENLKSKNLFAVIIQSSPNQGIYASMNIGIELSKGQWLYFTGCDDRFFDENVTNNIETAVLQNPAVDFLYGDVILESSESVYRGKTTLHDLMNRGNICHQAIFYKQDLFKRLGKYNTNYKIWADWDFNIRCFQHPEIVTAYIGIIIAYFNDLSGVSSLNEDPVFRQLLPVFNGNDLIMQLQTIRQSYAYRLGKKIFGWVDKLYSL